MSNRLLKTYTHKITSGYGQRRSGFHSGVDIVGFNGKYNVVDGIVAHSSGTVVQVQNGQKNNKGATGMLSYGNYVKIKHENYYTLYAHLDIVYVKAGQLVKCGQPIGIMGDTGNSYGAHLHFEVRNQKDVRIDPTEFISKSLPNPFPVPVRTIYYVKGATMKGNDVKWVQYDLREKGYTDKNGALIEIDGSFGPACDYAIRQFSKDNGILDAPERVGPKCRVALAK